MTNKEVEDFLQKINEQVKELSSVDDFDTLRISAGGEPGIHLGDSWEWNNMSIGPLTTSQLSPLIPSTVTTTNGTSPGQLSYPSISPLYNDTLIRTENHGQLRITGKDPDIIIGDKSLMKTLTQIEDMLGMLRPDPEMEQQWTKLKDLADQYHKLAEECRQKSQVWKALQQKG